MAIAQSGSLAPCLLSAIGTLGLMYSPRLGGFAASEVLQVFRAIFLHLKFYAVVYLLFAPEGDCVGPWLVDVLFPMVRINCYLSDHLITSWLGSLFSSDSVRDLVCWNILLMLEFLVLNFTLCSLSFPAVTGFCAMQGSDIQLTISAYFCKWTGNFDYWPTTLCFSMTVQWFVVACVVPSMMIADRHGQHASDLIADYKGDSQYCWLLSLGQVSAFIVWMHQCAVWLSAKIAIQLMISGAGVWILVYLHETMWPFQSRLVNQIVGDQFKGLWLLGIWLWWKDPLVFAAIVAFSLRKVVWH